LTPLRAGQGSEEQFEQKVGDYVANFFIGLTPYAYTPWGEGGQRTAQTAKNLAAIAPFKASSRVKLHLEKLRNACGINGHLPSYAVAPPIYSSATLFIGGSALGQLRHIARTRQQQFSKMASSLLAFF